MIALSGAGGARAEFLDWSDVTWTAGSLGPRTYTGGDLSSSSVTVTVTDPSGASSSGTPVLVSGVNGFDRALRISPNFANSSQSMRSEFQTGVPVTQLTFSIGDIDTGSNSSPYASWQDVAVVTAFRGGTEVAVTVLSAGARVGVDTDGNSYATGLNAVVYGTRSLDEGLTTGNATFRVNGPVDRVRVDYRAGNTTDGIPGEGPSAPNNQWLHFHDLVFLAQADLSLAKVASTTTPAVGSTVTYTLTLTNGGPAAATGVRVADVLPTGLSYVAGSIAGGTSRNAAGAPTLTWDQAILASGANAVLTYQATVSAPTGAANEYRNAAQVTVAPQPDPDSTPNNGATNTEDDRASVVIAPSFCAVTLVPDRSATVSAAQTRYFAHVLTNTGNASDTFDLASVTSGGFTPSPIAYYRDLGIVGVYEAGTDVLLADTDGDTIPDTGSLAASASLNLLVAATAPNAALSGSANVATTATSSLGASCTGTGAAFATATDTLTAGAGISGFVYDDANHDATRNAGEAGTGLTLYAKLIAAATPAGPASQVVAVDPGTGAFAFTTVTAGDWILVYDTSSAVADVAPTLPAAWLRTEESDATRSVTLGSTQVTGQDFGLFHGSRVEGVEFDDDGTGGGVAGNGLLDGTEGGIAGVAVRADASGCGGACDTDTTDATGAFTLWIPFAANGQGVAVAETNAAGFVSTGGSAGTTGGSYAIATDAVTFTNATGTVYTSVRFADFSGSGFAPNHQRAAMPGSAVFYPHVFSAGPGGSVRFSASNVASPATGGFSQAVFHDTDCSATLDASEPQLQPSDAIAVGAGGMVCVILRESVPPNAASGVQDLVTVTATFTAAGGATGVFTVTDLTTVGLPSGLVLEKSVDKPAAEPGEVLVYTIAYRNDGAAPITQLVIADATPGYTTFVAGSASCGALPAALTGCAPAPPPDPTGTVTWSFGGALAPSASGTVTYSVRID